MMRFVSPVKDYCLGLMLVSLVLLLSACGGGNHQAMIVAIGDSITLMAADAPSLCLPTDTLETCTASGRDHPQDSYATYLPNVLANLGRGGDTCTQQQIYPSGIFAGKSRGVLARLDDALSLHPDVVSVLIGVNDLNGWQVASPWHVTQDEVMSCIVEVWARIRAAGAEPVAMTYGPMNDTIMLGWRDLNKAIRTEAAARGIRVVDCETIPNYAVIDGIHPDKATAEAIAKLWAL